MDMFKEFKEKLGIDEKMIYIDTKDEVNAKRYEMVQNLKVNLHNIGFTDKEITEVTSIIEECQMIVQKIKDDILYNDVSTNASHEVMDEKIDQITEIERKTAAAVKEKIEEIVNRKKKA
jgi:hypothetical protein